MQSDHRSGQTQVRGDLRFNRMRLEEDSARSLRTPLLRKGVKEVETL